MRIGLSAALLLLCGTASASTHTLAEFVGHFRRTDHQLELSRLKVRAAKLAESRAGDRAASDLSYAPGYTYTRNRVEGSAAASYDDRDFSQTLGYARTAGFATRFGATAGHAHDNSTLYGSKQDVYSAGLSASQPLWRNRFGGLWDLDRRSKRQALASAERSHDDATLTRLTEAVRLYSDAYVEQEKESVFSELLENMRKIWKQSEKDYRKKLITKLNYLASKSNWLQMLDTKESIESQKKKRFDSLNFYVDAPWDSGLGSPARFFVENPVAEAPDFDAHPSIVSLDRRIAALSIRARYIDRDNAPDVSLDGAVDYSHTANAQAYSGREDDLWKAKVGFTVALPLRNPKGKYDGLDNSNSLASARRERAELIRSLKDRWAVQRREHAKLETQLRLNAERLKLYALQIDEAYRRFRRGRMEFQDYLQHWDLYQNARINELDLKRRLWAAQLELIRLRGVPPVFGGRG